MERILDDLPRFWDGDLEPLHAEPWLSIVRPLPSPPLSLLLRLYLGGDPIRLLLVLIWPLVMPLVLLLLLLLLPSPVTTLRVLEALDVDEPRPADLGRILGGELMLIAGEAATLLLVEGSGGEKRDIIDKWIEVKVRRE